MPLLSGKSNDIIHENYKTSKNEGKSEAQSWAIAFSKAGRTKKKMKSVGKQVVKKLKVKRIPLRKY